jgi:hypothetical protein
MAKQEVSDERNVVKERPSYAGPKPDALRKNLAGLVAEGFMPENVADKGGDLLELRIVTSRVTLGKDASNDQREIATAEAFIALVGEVADNKKLVRQRKYRRLLRYVLPLENDCFDMDVEERRTAAGKNLFGGSKEVKPGTIRTYYEPRALDELARVLVEMEAESRGEAPPGAGV